MIPDKIIVYALSTNLPDFLETLMWKGFTFLESPIIDFNIITIDLVKKEIISGFDRRLIIDNYDFLRNSNIINLEVLMLLRNRHQQELFSNNITRIVYKIPYDTNLVLDLIEENNKTIKKDKFEFIDFGIDIIF